MKVFLFSLVFATSLLTGCTADETETDTGTTTETDTDTGTTETGTGTGETGTGIGKVESAPFGGFP